MKQYSRHIANTKQYSRHIANMKQYSHKTTLPYVWHHPLILLPISSALLSCTADEDLRGWNVLLSSKICYVICSKKGVFIDKRNNEPLRPNYHMCWVKTSALHVTLELGSCNFVFFWCLKNNAHFLNLLSALERSTYWYQNTDCESQINLAVFHNISSSHSNKVREGIFGHGPSFHSLVAVFANNSTVSESSKVGYGCTLTVHEMPCPELPLPPPPLT